MQDAFSGVVGQESAIQQLIASAKTPVHAYLFVGPAGVGKRESALSFASLLLNDPRALTENHPDLMVIEREGASLTVAQAREIGRLSIRTPIEGSHKVLILTDFHLVDEAAPALLKTVEEASTSTTFIILAESIPKELVTIASRCVRIDFRQLPKELIEKTLRDEGVDEQRSKQAAQGAFGSLSRARILVNDDSVNERYQLWKAALSRLDGSGFATIQLVDEILQSIDHALSPLLEVQEKEYASAENQVKELGKSVTFLKNLQTRHKREQRRLRIDELKLGFATLAEVLSQQYAGLQDLQHAHLLEEGLQATNWANKSLQYNPNETLLLWALFMRLSQGAGRLFYSASV